MSVIRIASRYAKSLIELAGEEKKLERVHEDMVSFLSAIKNRDLYLLIKSPIVNTQKKEQIFKILFEKSMDELTSSFLQIILKKGREEFLPEIADQFVEQYKEIKSISTVKVTSAKKLSSGELKAIEKKLLETGIVDGTVDFVEDINPEIIGGFVVQIGDRLYDASVSRRLRDLKKEFTDNKFVKAL